MSAIRTWRDNPGERHRRGLRPPKSSASPFSGLRTALAASLVLCLAALNAAPAAAAPVRAVDGQGTAICLPAPAGRIVCLYGAFSELFLAMDAGGSLVARTTADAHIPGLADLPEVGTHMRPNIELVVGRRPDLVVQLGGRGEAMQAVDALRGHGVPVAVYNPKTFDELFAAIRSMGALAGREARAEALVAGMRTRLDAVAWQLKDIRQRPRVFFEIRARSLLAAGHGGLVDDVIRAAGGVNAVDSAKKIARLGEEGLYGLDPDVYVVQRGPMNKNPLPPSQRPLYAQLRAVRLGRVVEVDEHLFSRPGPQVVHAVEVLAAFLHPDAMNNKEPK